MNRIFSKTFRRFPRILIFIPVAESPYDSNNILQVVKTDKGINEKDKIHTKVNEGHIISLSTSNKKQNKGKSKTDNGIITRETNSDIRSV
jgi:hypothetical protein